MAPDLEYRSDPRLPENVLVVDHGDDEERYSVTWGKHPEDGTEAQYVFTYMEGIYVHTLSTVHRHDDDGRHTDACEQVPAEEEPAPDPVEMIIADRFDAPVATRR